MAGVITDFKQLELVKGGKKEKIAKRMVTEKGHKNEFERFFEMVKKGSSEYDFEANVLTTLATIKAVESVQNGSSVRL